VITAERWFCGEIVELGAGITGFKPTFGIISRHGSFRGAWSQDHVGLFARTVRDITLGLDPVAGHDPRDPASVPQENQRYAARLDANIKGLKVAVLRPFLEGVNPAVKQAFESALQVFAGTGCEIVDVDVPELKYAAMTSTISCGSGSEGLIFALFLRETIKVVDCSSNMHTPVVCPTLLMSPQIDSELVPRVRKTSPRSSKPTVEEHE